jgi:hypothetical protein
LVDKTPAVFDGLISNTDPMIIAKVTKIIQTGLVFGCSVMLPSNLTTN